MKIGFIGAGRMGRPMVDRLIAAGDEVCVLVRSPEARSAVGSEPGVTAEETLQAVARAAEFVVICVHTDQQVRQICVEEHLIESMDRDSTLIVHTTGSPYTVQELQEVGVRHGVRVVDAPVSGGAHDIAAGTITVFVGGGTESVNSARRVLSRYADPIIHTGALGSGQMVKLVNNSIFLTNIEVISAAIQFGQGLGIDETTLINCLQQGSSRSYALDGVAGVGSSAGFRGAVGEFLEKDLAVVRDVAASMSADLGAIDRVLNHPAPAGSGP